MDDRQLVAGLRAGDEGAQEAFHARYHARLNAVCAHFLGWGDPEREDLVQETFALALKSLDSFDFRRDLYFWIRKICVNLCFKHLKRRQRLVVATEEELESASRAKAVERERDADHERSRNAARAMLRRAFEGLGSACREIVRLRDFEGHSYMDIARALRLAPGTVFSRLARCRGALKRLVEEMGGPEGQDG